RRKRKSIPKIDEVEDGARAIIVEEAISLFLFNQMKSRHEFRERNSIDISLLKTVKRLADGLEVEDCTAKQWQEAIFRGYEVFRALRDNRGGVVSLDLDKPAISYRPIASKPSRGLANARNSGRQLFKGVASRRAASPRQRRPGI